MISRLTAFATAFAILSTATLAFAASSVKPAGHSATSATPVVQLERVVVTGHRAPGTQR